MKRAILMGEFTVTGSLGYPTSTGPGMPSVRCLERQLLCKPLFTSRECHDDLVAPSLVLFILSMRLMDKISSKVFMEINFAILY